jgi:hypothetical protein
MVPVLVPTDDARAHQGYCCSIRRLNRYCRAVGRHAGSTRISFVLKTFGRAALACVTAQDEARRIAANIAGDQNLSVRSERPGS